MRILNVDDREENRYLVAALLTGHGHEVHSASHGAEALDLLQAGEFDLIITDILMPVMDGFELCRKVKADERFRRIPLLIYTATYTGPQDEAFALKIGADAFLQKPCEPDVFMKAVHDVMEKTAGKTVLPPPAPEEEVLKLYSERLVRKLEQKMLQLEQEVQARQKTEEVLQQSEKKYRSLYNSIRDAILVVDMNMNILDCNQAFVDLFGYALAEIAGTQIGRVFENQAENARVAAFLGTGTDHADSLYILRFRKKDGAVFPGEVNIFPLKTEEGSTAGYIGLIRDITERVEAETTRADLESRLHQAQKLESVGRLAGGISHDFNNMLSVILGYAQIALTKTTPGSSLNDDLREIHTAALRSAEITRQLLAFARKQTIAPRVLDLNAAVEGTYKMLKRLIGEDISLTFRPAAELWPVNIDPSQIDQILANLCVNARDAISGSGRITIATAAVTTGDGAVAPHADLPPGDYVLLTVGDNGCGMDRDTIEKIFEPFFTTKERGKGTGLGLATIYGIVKQNNGFITVASEPGRGTTFRIYLPRYTGNMPTGLPAEESAPGKGHGETVLIVEDEAAILKIIGTTLEDSGYVTHLADSAAAAVRLAAGLSRPLDLVITDVVLPDMSGKDLAARLSALHPGLKCLFISGYASGIITDRGLLEEGTHFLQKPFSESSLAAKVQAVLSGAP